MSAAQRAPTVEQLPFPRPLVAHRLDQHVRLPLTPDAQIPGRDLVGARAVALELRRARPQHLERDLAHILLEAPPAHVADRAPVLRDEQLRTLVAVGRAAHAHHGRERGAPARPAELREAIEDGPGFVPVLHATGQYLARALVALAQTSPRTVVAPRCPPTRAHPPSSRSPASCRGCSVTSSCGGGCTNPRPPS